MANGPLRITNSLFEPELYKSEHDVEDAELKVTRPRQTVVYSHRRFWSSLQKESWNWQHYTKCKVKMCKKCNLRALSPFRKWTVLQCLGLCECLVFITGTLKWGQKVKRLGSLMSCDLDKVLTSDFGKRPAATQSAGCFQKIPSLISVHQIKVKQQHKSPKKCWKCLKKSSCCGKSVKRFNLDKFSPSFQGGSRCQTDACAIT